LGGGRAEGPGCTASVDLSLIETVAGLWCTLRRLSSQIRRVEVILARNSDQGEQGIAPGVGQRRAHAARRCHLGQRTHRPVRGNPLARGVGKHRGERHRLDVVVDDGRL
jgi:hypothetical protein